MRVWQDSVKPADVLAAGLPRLTEVLGLAHVDQDGRGRTPLEYVSSKDCQACMPSHNVMPLCWHSVGCSASGSGVVVCGAAVSEP